MPTYLEGVAVQFYRGIGPETQYIAPFTEMNFFVGPNNAGKSIVLNLIKDRLPFGVKPKMDLEPNSSEAYRGRSTGSLLVSVGISKDRFMDNLEIAYSDRFANIDAYDHETVTEALYKFQRDGIIWLIGKAGTTPNIWWGAQSDGRPINRNRLPIASIARASGYNINTVGQKDRGAKALDLLLAPQTQKLPDSFIIPAKRRLGAGDETFDDLSGKGLIRHLAEIQNPDHHERERKVILNQINTFVQAVTGKPDAQLEVPNHRKHLLVHMDNKVLPLDSLGTGIHEVILIAAFCTIHQKKIMCIEEPEIHLHPVLQRKLIRYLQEKTENQYFIATHSAAFIDTPGASVFRVHNDGVQTYVTPAITKGEQRQICDDLGYRASDILQANAVIWVEGPSDRIYIRHWLNAVNPDLIEGVHYTIMFYGGGLIKHLSADDDAAADFIRLRDLNRHIAVVIDSDKEALRARLKSAAQRIKDEMKSDDSVVWITKGREIENYVKPDVLHEALAAIHPRVYGGMLDVGPYDHAFYFARKGPKSKDGPVYKDGDKVGAAERVCQQEVDLDVLDLRERVTALAGMIAKANGLEPKE